MKIQDLMETFYITEIHNVNFLTQVFKKLFYTIILTLSQVVTTTHIMWLQDLVQINPPTQCTTSATCSKLQHRVYLTVRLQKNHIAILTVKASGQQTTEKTLKILGTISYRRQLKK